ncbi:hypothetical protein VitviT2T_020555 [Vitis vinifera]|uniref:Disease resistance protein RGA3 n=1 Tax=Vitis vinifera TaxID=29760 RepID=A0ABY9D6D4_VITVI|nr:putative disease resistance protein RGA4 [Vitis vinifera]XP_019079437.1 putative disease resistance protein RGA4 [Vitis vinifera]XP_019079438.1 putative disease resistance protein RGA4 [Vitis vinifera]XP_019079439.1 putative disease resistance protein RGA4 [Vitis vinifera]XP_019079440.1 putative disease resistance protein RGA4 [Vitis vinifera]XP_019079441.1 putative disease resistance protein RGA4 [Vitis vinifera]XP_019079442.1 putative disease resistance protein RGA4 [Vitis vinifera]XP_0|eukprot:XP_019079436.1 PREDICTED: putative disease resistance protein RGA4 [Vitis vinifera]
MAEQIPFSIAEEILTKLGSLVAQEIGLARGVRKELKRLEDTLTTIKAVLLDAEERQEREHAVEVLVKRFKDVIYDADDLLDDFATYELGRGGMARQVSRFFSSSNQAAFHFRMGHRIKDIRGRLDGIANDISKFNFIPRATTSMRVGNTGRETHSFVLMSEIIGRDEDKEKIIEILLQSNNEENLSVVAIVGIGGLGKTTLAQLVYNDEKVENHFELRLWVCVSDDFDVKIIVRNIIKSAKDENVDNLGLEQLKDKLHEKLTQKRYLLVLDDVWNEDSEKWNQLRILLKVGARGSKVVVTTRNSKVASIMGIDSPYVLEGLNEGQSWALFKSLAFGEDQQNAHPSLLKIGEEITKMCNGVPLVIRTLGRIPKSKWSSIKNNKNLMSLQDGNNILKVLKLSYDNLPSHLKQCFTYCALFPKDYAMKKKMLIQLWMAQGYIQPLDENEHLEDVGDQYFKELLSWSMFQDVKIDDNNNIISCKMHDLIHDLAQFIVKSEIFILTNDTNDVKTIPERIYHVSILGWSQGMKVVSKGKSIRTLFMPNNDHDPCATSMVNSLLLNCKCLRALSLDALRLTVSPKSVIKLRRLRYLDLSWCDFEVLPSGITSLQNLQTLKLFFCHSLRELPRDMRSLRHLEIDFCDTLNYMPCKLTMLQTLRLVHLHALEYMFKNSSSAEPFPSLKTLELGELRYFKGWWRERGEQAPSFPSLSQLLISNCDRLTTVQLPSCPSLSKFEIQWCSELTTVQLPSCPSLSKFEISHCNQLTTVQLPSCPSLSEFEIHRCNQLTTVQLPSCPSLSKFEISWSDYSTAVQLLSSPTKLVINNCKNFKSLQLSSCSSLSELEISFCGLTTFELSSCPLSQWLIMNCDQLTTVQLPASCPSLSKLEIRCCNQLTTVQLLSSPTKLVIDDCRSFKSLQLPSCSSLSELEISSCDLTTFELSSCPSLSTLEIRWCDQLTTVQLLSSPHLSKLVISSCHSLKSLQLPSCPSLSELEISRCHQLTTVQLQLQVPSLPCLEKLKLGGVREEILWQIILVSSSLKSLQIWNINDLVSLPDDRLQHLTSLKSLQINYFPGLMSWFEGIQHITTLETLEINDCDDFTTIPDWISSLTSLSKLQIRSCPRFKLEDRSKIAHIREIDIQDCSEL